MWRANLEEGVDKLSEFARPENLPASLDFEESGGFVRIKSLAELKAEVRELDTDASTNNRGSLSE